MKNLKLASLLFFSLVLLSACSSDDTPEPVNEPELITTVKVTLTPTTAGLSTVTLESTDIDGDEGPTAPVNDVDGDLITGETYMGTVEFLNETEDPAEDVTEEVEREDDEHQVFFTAGSGLAVTTSDLNLDGDGNPLGTTFTLTAGGTASSGTFTVTLRHEPTKPNGGDLTVAGGETDAERTFTVNVVAIPL